jgi:hypothetical protein
MSTGRRRLTHAERVLRPGTITLPSHQPDPEIEALASQAPAVLTTWFGVMLPGYPHTEERHERLRHAGHVWRNCVETEPLLAAWVREHLIEWMDAMPVLLPSRRGGPRVSTPRTGAADHDAAAACQRWWQAEPEALRRARAAALDRVVGAFSQEFAAAWQQELASDPGTADAKRWAAREWERSRPPR